MLSGVFTRAALHLLDRIPLKSEPQSPAHLITGRRGEEDAYFYLRRKGYVMVARNYRTACHRGEIDLIGWDKDVICFIEVKTRTTHDVKPAQAAVDRKKRRDLRIVIRDYLHTLPRRQFPEPPPWRFDVITVYYEGVTAGATNPVMDNSSANAPASKARRLPHPTFELFQNAALSS
jgi:putative endonuclease